MIPIFGQALSFCAQLFFSWRCFTLMNRNWYLLGFLLTSACNYPFQKYPMVDLDLESIGITTSFALAIVVGYRYAVDQLNSSLVR